MNYKYLFLIIAMNLILLISCKKETNPLAVTSNIFYTQENSSNHLKLEISSTSSMLKHTENINFTSDSILVIMKIEGLEEGRGTGDIHLYSGVNSTFAAYYFNRDTLISDTLLTDTLIYKAPDRATVTFKNFTGFFKFEMDGL